MATNWIPGEARYKTLAERIAEDRAFHAEASGKYHAGDWDGALAMFLERNGDSNVGLALAMMRGLNMTPEKCLSAAR